MTTDSTTVAGSDTGIPANESDETRWLQANIPVRSWFYMLLYAWDLAKFRGELDAIVASAPDDLRALLTKVLAHYTRKQIRRGLRGDYVDLSEPLRTVRGRIHFGRTVSDLLLYKGELHCDYQEYSLNVPRNQIIVSTLNRQLRHRYMGIEQDGHAFAEFNNLKAELEALVRTMNEIDRVSLSDRMIATEMRKLGRNEREYRLIMLICQWLNGRPRLPAQGLRGRQFMDIDELVKWKVYEKFVANFMKMHCDEWNISAPKGLSWNDARSERNGNVKLPGMQPDIVLTNKRAGHRVVIDTKWYSSATVSRFGRETVHNSNLYQMWAYLSSQDVQHPEHSEATGILLYAQTQSGPKWLRTRIDGHPFWVHTLDLSQPWQRIEDDLLGMIGSINMDRQDLQD